MHFTFGFFFFAVARDPAKRKQERETPTKAKRRDLDITPASLRRESGRSAELRDGASLTARDSVGKVLLSNDLSETSPPLRRAVSEALAAYFLPLPLKRPSLSSPS